jgi:hypothetical protein
MPESHSETVALAVRAATEWIEAATGRRFPPDRTFRATLEDGVLLCELMDNLSPGLLRHTPHLVSLQSMKTFRIEFDVAHRITWRDF